MLFYLFFIYYKIIIKLYLSSQKAYASPYRHENASHYAFAFENIAMESLSKFLINWVSHTFPNTNQLKETIIIQVLHQSTST